MSDPDAEFNKLRESFPAKKEVETKKKETKKEVEKKPKKETKKEAKKKVCIPLLA